MRESPTAVLTIDEYIAQFPPAIQALLSSMRTVIQANAPAAREQISYRMPAFAQRGILVYFAAFTDHIGFYPTASGVAYCAQVAPQYITGKGTLRFPFHEPLPLDLVASITRFRLAENLARRPRRAPDGAGMASDQD